MRNRNIWLSVALGLFCVCIGVFLTTVGISVLSFDLSNVFARVIVAAFGVRTTTTIVVGFFFTGAGIYCIVWGLLVWIALLTQSSRLERAVFGKKGR